MPITLKICGINSESAIQTILKEGGCKYLGFVFYHSSPRNISVQEAKDLTSMVPNNIKKVALWTSVGVFLLSLFIWLQFDSSNSGYQFQEKFRWFSDFNFYYHIGIDGISLFMVILSTFLTPLCILASWVSIKKRVKE